MKALVIGTIAASLLVGSACSTNGPGGDDPTGNTTPIGDAPPLDHPPIDDEALPVKPAAVRRLSLSQLRRILPLAFGLEADGTTPVTWHLEDGRQGLNAMAPTLGEPDYIEVTEENLEASPMYVKFMDDAARDVCNRAIDADIAKTNAAERVVMRHAGIDADSDEAISKNLAYLVLRLHGVRLEAGDEDIARWQGVYDGALAEAKTAAEEDADAKVEAWNAVCVALTVAPEFHLY
ncbi:MAG: hypothetical protein HOW73_38655 [Polyangiaceae bacterium]|nr:hypothetical protein [Polyangiaceae bacterium]